MLHLCTECGAFYGVGAKNARLERGVCGPCFDLAIAIQAKNIRIEQARHDQRAPMRRNRFTARAQKREVG